jgi:putative transposase
MSRPARPSDPELRTGKPRQFFVTTRTAGGRSLFQTERMANLFIEVLRTQVRLRRFVIHEFVVMPNHVHLLLTLPGEMSLEKAMQFVKGGFSFQAKRVLGFNGEVWQRGFSDVWVGDEGSYLRHKQYIFMNPVRAGLVTSPDEFPHSTAFLKKQKQPGAKAPHTSEASIGTTEVGP